VVSPVPLESTTAVVFARAELMALPEYTEVEDALVGGGSQVSASECHGVLCGILCASGSSDMQGWVRHLFESRSEKKEISAQALKILHDVHQVTVDEINHETLEFSLLLPDAAESLDLRIGALADWCGGFSLGLSMGGLQDPLTQVSAPNQSLKSIPNSRWSR